METDEIRKLFEEYDRKAELRYRAILTEVEHALAMLRILRLEDKMEDLERRAKKAEQKGEQKEKPSLIEIEKLLEEAKRRLGGDSGDDPVSSVPASVKPRPTRNSGAVALPEPEGDA